MNNLKKNKVVSIRVSEQLKNSLDELAYEDNISLNELGTQALEEFVAARNNASPKTSETTDDNGGLAPTPESLSPFERKLLQLQSLNLAALGLYFQTLPDAVQDKLTEVDHLQSTRSGVPILASLDPDVYAEAAEMLALGFTSEYHKAIGGLDAEMPNQNGNFVHQVLGMFSHLKAYLSDPRCEIPRALRNQLLESIVFLGFESNDDAEAQMGSLAAHLVKKGLYENIKDDIAPNGFCKVRVGGASHLYRQMLVVYNRVMRNHFAIGSNADLTSLESELISIARICNPHQWSESHSKESKN
ncbi:MAG: YfbU family protein [Corynebacterium sp.]|nr:YfbU family protein [Corynebacterium sp.]